MLADDVQDVLIIGGGPAGSTAATFLARQGHSVTLLEKEQFPRDHVGESLLPFCYRLFEELGVLDELKASFVRKPGVRFVDRDGRTTTTWCFSRVIPDETHLSFQVNRADFDLLLLNNARRNGATVLEQTRVERVTLDRPDGIVEVQAAGPSGRQMVRARFLLDCSGRSSFLASSRGERKKFAELDRTALWSHYRGGELRGGLEEGISLITYIGGEKKGWIWVFPLGPNWLTVGVVLNNAYIRAQKAKFEQDGVKEWRQALFEQELGYSPFVMDVIRDHTMTMPLLVEGDYSYFSETKYGANYAMVGDAAQFIDPIFSSGVYLAMRSAQLVSNAVHCRFGSGAEAGQAEMKLAYDKIAGAYRLILKLITFFYDAGAINFAQMESAVEAIHQEHENAMAVGHYLLAGDFFERYEHYGGVIDALRKPHLYQYYKEDVLGRVQLQATSCDADPAVVFHRLKAQDATSAMIAS